mmetsp:Transcript_11055/g.15878  ORF Transcript_11055/g.15878 Transcript_11055/m.15878 type:complete len:180 (+) Transcript_11055:25-564(+)|eukprot:CAMPEP_0175112220 /NCGR_PEP_ID=MMETSP0086_2-20121207/15339_1 /TAXON_ID=136419 /ORGANISM="Unknown Unknown, Strain D1" /LENGTH=179 /DNA_ID=CAMNT_0016391053 /DNA_START=25 /DNA_END=564 /DNA_ORIENTATION=+
MSVKPYNGKLKGEPVWNNSKREIAKELLAKEDKHLFFCIERNMNSNQVCYYLNMKDGKVDEKNPISVEWIMWEKGAKGEVREGLTFIENNTAYGITCTPAKDGYTLVISSLKKSPMHVSVNLETKEVAALIEIEGKKAQLLRVFAHAVKGWTGLPSVEYCDWILKFEGSDKEEHRRVCP